LFNCYLGNFAKANILKETLATYDLVIDLALTSKIHASSGFIFLRFVKFFNLLKRVSSSTLKKLHL